MNQAANDLVDAIGRELLDEHQFSLHYHHRMQDLGCIGFWRRCTLNWNRAVAVLQRPEGEFEIGPYCQQMKWKLRRCTFTVPFIYEVGLQLVVVGDEVASLMKHPAQLNEHVDFVGNQFVVLQSIFIADTKTMLYSEGRTWGQTITGKFQDAIVRTIKKAGYAPLKFSASEDEQT